MISIGRCPKMQLLQKELTDYRACHGSVPNGTDLSGFSVVVSVHDFFKFVSRLG
jgi:hypothetical protein